MITILLNILHSDAHIEVRYHVAVSLGQLGQISAEVIAKLLEVLHQAKSWSARRNSARLLGQIGQSDELTIQALCRGLIEQDNSVRTECAQTLAKLGRRFPDAVETIESKLVQAIEDPAFDEPDSIEKRSAHDYAYEGL